MKRPEGFDPPGRQQPVPPGRRPAQPSNAKAEKSAAKARPTQPARPTAAPNPAPRPAPSEPRPRPPRGASSRQARPDAAARSDLRRAARERRKFERSEVRRFTRRARNRRLVLAAVAGTLATLIVLVFVAIYSPILALRTITVDGTARVNSTEVTAAVSSQLGTPLALIDYGRITDELAAFPLIRSYVTEAVPPDTLIIHITERQPVGAIQVGGVFRLVDPAGIVVQESAERVPGVPIIDIGGADTTGPVFASVVAVLIAMPSELLAQVDAVTATTPDNVSLVLTGVGQRVTWGSADDSAAKAILLAALIRATDPNQAGVFDVSAPTNGVFRPS